VQQLKHLMLEKVRLQYEGAMTKPLDIASARSKHF
jgi:hypothetical protein